MTPDARRRIAGALMAEQYNRPTPQDTEVVERGGLLPVGTYANGMSGPALPGFITQPFESFKRLVDQGYESGNPQGAEDAFNVAGAAMVGGLAAPRPRGAVAPKEQPLVGYRGSAYGGTPQSPTYWASGSADTAADYARAQALDAPRNQSVTGQSITPSEFRFNNPLKVDAAGESWWDVPFNGQTISTDNLARAARGQGHDGLIVSNVRDGVFGDGAPQTTIAALQPGTVYSPLTGELLYANGGRPGAAVGAAASTADIVKALMQEDDATKYRGAI